MVDERLAFIWTNAVFYFNSCSLVNAVLGLKKHQTHLRSASEYIQGIIKGCALVPGITE